MLIMGSELPKFIKNDKQSRLTSINLKEISYFPRKWLQKNLDNLKMKISHLIGCRGGDSKAECGSSLDSIERSFGKWGVWIKNNFKNVIKENSKCGIQRGKDLLIQIKELKVVLFQSVQNKRFVSVKTTVLFQLQTARWYFS